MSGIQDPISDLLTRIRNAIKSRKVYVDVSFSRMKEEIAKILKEEGFIAHYLVKEESKKGCMRIFLKYDKAMMPLIQGLKRLSKPSQRVYYKREVIPNPLNGLGLIIMSTNRGVLSGTKAKQINAGGEALCMVW